MIILSQKKDMIGGRYPDETKVEISGAGISATRVCYITSSDTSDFKLNQQPKNRWGREMMKMKKLWVTLSVVLSFMLVFAACDPVGGLNLNNVMKSPLEQISYEGRTSISIEIIPGEDLWLPDNEILGMLSFIPNIEINIDEYKQQDLMTASMAGDISFAGLSIPFAVSVTPREIVIAVEGIERPFVIDTAASLTELDIELDTAQYNEMSLGFTKSLYNYLIPNLPNPDTIEVMFDTTEINGVVQNLRKIHAEIYGHEVFKLIEKLLDNLLKNEQALRKFVEETYDISKPLLVQVFSGLKQSFEMEEWAEPEDTFIFDLLLAYVDNKTLVTEFMQTTLKQIYAFVRGQLDAMKNEAEYDMLNESSYVFADLYVSANSQIVRADYEIFLSPNAEAGGIAINMSTEKWNINQPVEVDLLSSENGIYISEFMDEEEILNAVDGQSMIGQLLTAFGLNEKRVYIWLDEADVIIENNTTLIHSFDAYYELGIDIDWTSYYVDDQIVYTDGNLRVEFPLDRNVMIVNGVEVAIPVGAKKIDYSIYVPLRALAETFGYEVTYDPVFRTVDLVKTYF